ncbi:preprotein translocase subunit SecA [Aquifex aeolicus]|uniref:Protein translocase subunit SecA n=1 Tax=Aquifex aeolicus (strain VF5) TaxID=224324 RepID=SECA_AQUAE|nr:preprotein translocase subunit SecA [Aquifex aeolicus]O67718.1 RecName: Full=Protein translocase subunit SecA [Aquifex aeolicus VF5]AAC07677.1 preprotein translocase SecA subunit [Aquifex aeolicus VF5]
MLGWIAKKIIGTKNEREVKRLRKFVNQINELEKELDALTNKELVELAQELHDKIRFDEELKERVIKGEITPEVIKAFALVREAAKRTLGLRHFDVQLIGGLVLHEGKIAEMKTGEGKTLVATSPAVVNGMTDEGVHIVTVNDYLARRDAQWMGPIYKFLGLEVGVINSDGKTYLVEWVDPEKVKEAIENDVRVWPKGYYEEILPSEKVNIDAKKTYFTTLKEAEHRRKAYEAHITYGTNNEFGFDYLRDNLAFSKEEIVQVKGHNYAIVDEVDSILIDEARTPLIISGPAQIDSQIYHVADAVVRKLKKDKDFTVDEKNRTVNLTEQGIKKVEKMLGIDNLYDLKHVDLLHAILQSIRAHHLFKKDVHYIVRDGEVLIVDEFTGRVLPGRRWSDGLHQAIEVKEGVPVKEENQTLASITFQNYFKLYRKLAGMTGTAETEALEFKEIYGLDVVVIPTHKPMIRKDHPDLVFKTKEEKWERVVEEVLLNHIFGRPVLVGTVSIEDNEKLSSLLKNKKLLKEIANRNSFKRRLEETAKNLGVSPEEVQKKLEEVLKKGIPHNVLNAKHHEREAEIIAQAGRVGAVTIATNMAGRGTDILLGGNPEYLAKQMLKEKGINPEEATEEQFREALREAYRITEEEKEKVKKLGGLLVIGTERHESRRIDNQLRGRAGRQGDPGESRFIVSLEDDLLRLFGGERVSKLMDMLKIERGEPIESRMVSKALENAQKRVEAQNFQIRKRLYEFDSVMNIQRDVVYTLRRQLLEGENVHEKIKEFLKDIITQKVNELLPEDDPELWDLEPLKAFLKELTGREVEIPQVRDKEELIQKLYEELLKIYEEKEKEIGSPEAMRELERVILLNLLDNAWREHLHTLDRLREGIYLRGYAGKDPLIEYKREAYELFENMMENVKLNTLMTLFNVQIKSEEEIKEVEHEEEKKHQRLLEEAELQGVQGKSDKKPRPKTLKERLKEERLRKRKLKAKKKEQE